MKPAALAASITGPVDMRVLQDGHAESGVAGSLDESFLPFVRDGFLKQVGCNTKVPVKILKVPAAFDSYVLEPILTFSEKADTGDIILMRVMWMDVLPVPVHRVNLDCELVQGVISLGVRPALPVEGIYMIWGNNSCG